MKKIMKLLRRLRIYLKYRDSINELYSYSLKGKYGEQVGEGWGWYERTDWWLSSI